MGTPKTFFVGVKGIIVRADKVLLLRKTGDRVFWDAPGGRINSGETAERAFLRELREELPSIGDITVGRLLHAHVLDRDIKGDISLTLLFYEIDAVLENIVLSSEHSDYEWMSFDEACRVGSEGVPEALNAR